MASVKRVTRTNGARWQARVRLPGGRVLTRTFPTEKEANTWGTLMEADKSRGALPENLTAGRVTFREWAEDWLESRPLRDTTRRAYRSILDRHLLPTFGGVALNKVTPAMVRRWHGKAAATARRTGRGELQVPKAYRLLRVIMATAVADELIARNPVNIAKAGQEPRREREFYDLPDLWDLAEAMTERAPHVRALVLTAGLAGLRRGELLGLRRADVDPLHRTIRVARQVVQSGTHRQVVALPKTDAGVRTVRIDPVLAAELEAHLATYTAPDPDAPLFVGDKGGHLSEHTLYRHLHACRTALGWPDTFHLHDLRHLAATTYAAQGATTRELMAHGGWANPDAAMRYQHAAARRAEHLADRMGDAVLAALEERERAGKSNVVDLERARTARAAVAGGGAEAPGRDETPGVPGVSSGAGDGNRTRTVSLGS
jgi:integrase